MTAQAETVTGEGARSIVAITSHEDIARALSDALAEVAPGLEVVRSFDQLGASLASLWIVVDDGSPAWSVRVAALPGTAPVIAVVQEAALATFVELMQRSERIACAVASDQLPTPSFGRLVTRILHDDLFGIARQLRPGTQVVAHVVRDHRDKLACMAAVAAFVERSDGLRRLREPIEQCLDEAITNALYSAPVGEGGKRVFADVSARARILLRTEYEVTVEYACDGEQLAIGVRDAFGSLDRHTFVRQLHKGLHAEDKVDRKASGAGLGLYLIASLARTVHVHVVPGAACEVVSTFALEPGPRGVATLGFCVQRDRRDFAPAGHARVLPAEHVVRRRRIRLAAIGLTVMILAVGLVIGWPRIFGPKTADVRIITRPAGAIVTLDGRTLGTTASDGVIVRELAIDRGYAATARLDGYEPKSTVIRTRRGANRVILDVLLAAPVTFDSVPSGAWIAIDGKPMGSTPLALTSLAPSQKATAVIEMPGYRPASLGILAPARGEAARHLVKLDGADDLVSVRFESNPPGAELIRDGTVRTSSRTYAPAVLFLEADRRHVFTMRMPGHVPVRVEPFVPVRGEATVKRGTLVAGATLHIVAKAGTVTVSGAPHCQQVNAPFDCTLAPGTYVVELTRPDATHIQRTVAMGGDDKTEVFE